MQTDRWIEMDLFFFQEKPFQKQAREVVERFVPLFREVGGDHGLILCCAWLCDLVTEWNGDPAQPLPFRSPTMRGWSERSYADLKELLRVLKDEAAQAGLPRLKVGLMMVAWGTFNWGEGGGYDLQSGWYDRHREIYFDDGWKNIDYRKRLKQDGHRYASRPGGISEGTSFADFFSGQWALLSRFLEADVVHFRDGFLGPAIYEMTGPFGNQGPKNPADAEEWSRELIAFFTAAKQANPDCLVMAYSSARSPVGEYRVGCFDLEALVASGGIDVWIDQTWAGAWQDWWTHEFRGWTFQLANLIAHHIMVVAGNRKRSVPCRHYHLVETWDAWEPWDTLHQVPSKLRWGIWAFTHAAVAAPEGLSRTSGTYLSWAHNWQGRLLSSDDVGFLQRNLDAAVRNAGEMEEVYGPALALNLPQMAAQRKSNPTANPGDLIDDECAMLTKWAFPCLSGVGLDAPPIPREGYLLQTPAGLSPEWLDHLKKPDAAWIAAGPAHGVDAALLSEIGVEDGGKDFPFGKHHLETPELAADVTPRVSSVCMAPSRLLRDGSARVAARSEKTILIAQSRNQAKFLWQPPSPFVPWISYLGQSQYGSLAPFIVLSRVWRHAVRDSASAWVEDFPPHLPVAFHLWRSGGHIFVLAGNLETGITGDARTDRELTFTLRKKPLRLSAEAHVLREVDEGMPTEPVKEDVETVRFRIRLAPESCCIYQVLVPTLGLPGDTASGGMGCAIRSRTELLEEIPPRK